MISSISFISFGELTNLLCSQLYALICKSFGDLDQVLLLAYEILRQAPIWKTQLLYAVAQWWPDPFIAKGIIINIKEKQYQEN